MSLTFKSITLQPPTTAVNDEEFWRDGQGRLVPAANIGEIDQLRDDLVRRIAGDALTLEQATRDYLAGSMADINAFVELSAERYGARYKGLTDAGKGNIQLMSFDQKYRLSVRCADLIRFDERLQAAKTLIDEVIIDLAKDADPVLIGLVNDTFQVDKAGRINTARVLSLRRYKIDDERWKQAMDAIADSVTQVGTSVHLYVHERIGPDVWRPVVIEGVRHK